MSIQVRNISKSFGSFKALDRVSTEVKTGELIALLGPSGSGKTTLLRIIAGLDRPDPGEGQILFHDKDVAKKHVKDRKVGFVFQQYALFRHMTVFENVAFGLRVKPRKERPTSFMLRLRVYDLLKLVQLDGLAGRYPHQLSGGQRQRVALARALAVEPDVLLLDEPFGALDAKVRMELRCWLRTLHDELNITSVFVTHDQDEALELADRVVVMNEGHIEQEGSPDEIFHHPQSAFVMDFLGTVNRFHGHLDKGRVHFAETSFDIHEGVTSERQEVHIFIRPHRLEVDVQRNGHDCIPAVVHHINSAGSAVRLVMQTHTKENLHAEMSQERFHALGIACNSSVFVTPQDFRVFPANPNESVKLIP